MQNNQEIWKDIQGYEGKYQVSNLGKVVNKGTLRILKSFVNCRGYLIVRLYISGQGRTKTIHRLVALAFIPNIKNKPQINHKDGDKLNNHADNLEWSTNTDNMIHAYALGLKVAPCGEKNGGSKLFEKDVLEIRKLFKDGVTRLNISILYKISRSQIERIVNRKRWRNI